MRAHLQLDSSAGTSVAIEDLHRVPLCVLDDVVHLCLQFHHFGVQGHTLIIRVRVVTRLDSKLSHTGEHGSQFCRRPISRLQQGNAIVGVLDRHVKTADLRGHLVADGQPGSIVGRRVDTATCGELLHVAGQIPLVDRQSVLCAQGLQVGVDHGHGVLQ